MVSPRLYVFGRFRLDSVDKVLWHDDRPIPLTPKAIDTLLVLVARHGHLVTKEELLQLVWPDAFVEENNLAQNISTLRRVLGDGTGGERFIETVPKRGYRFVAAVTEPTPIDHHAGAVPPEPLLPPAAEPAAPSTITAPSGRRAPMWVAIAVAGLALIAVGVALTGDRRANAGTAPPVVSAERSTPALTRIAVLPFVNLGAATDAYFVAGMTEEITSRLAGLRGVAVPSSTTLGEYDRRGKSLSSIGADLRADYIVEGGVRWAQMGDTTRVRITPKLIRVADDTTVWTHPYETSLSDLFKVQAEIAYQIAGALQVAVDARERRAVEARPTADTDAYLAYLRGVASFQQGWSDTANLVQARAELENAVARDPGFALAWSWLARVCASQYRTAALRTPEIMLKAHRAAQKAIELDPGRPEVHLGLAQVLMTDRQYDAALRELDIARVGLPNSAELLHVAAVIEQRRGRWAESLAAYTRAFELDPASTAELIALHYMHQREYAEVRRYISVAKAAHRSAVLVPEAWLHFSERGDIAAARRVLESARRSRSPADSRVLGLLARLEFVDGHPERALELIAGMDSAGAWLPPNFRFPATLAAGQVYESMGRREAATRSYAAAMAESRRRQLAAPEDHQNEAALALAAAGLGHSAEAVAHGRRAVELLPVSKDAAEGPLYLYLLAQVQARVGDHAGAFATLDELFSVPGFYNERWVQHDPGFASLWRHPLFQANLARWSRQRGDVLLGAAALQPRQ
jgi:DNA-binding winged helix-turn-helix (wHTH) protein/TolB-like protein/Tfp pilus assembly protein PilF